MRYETRERLWVVFFTVLATHELMLRDWFWGFMYAAFTLFIIWAD